MEDLLPLFPLQLVALPGIAIPLHIFEDRYRRMVGEAEAAGTEFGIVLAKKEGIVNTGCSVLVERITQRYSDGRFDVITRGRRRFLINSVNHELDYLRAKVDFFDDDDFTPVPEGLRARAIAACKPIDADLAPDPDDPFLSFHLAHAIPDLDFQALVQRTRSEFRRLTAVEEAAAKFIARRDYATKMRTVAGTNGHGRKHQEHS